MAPKESDNPPDRGERCGAAGQCRGSPLDRLQAAGADGRRAVQGEQVGRYRKVCDTEVKLEYLKRKKGWNLKWLLRCRWMNVCHGKITGSGTARKMHSVDYQSEANRNLLIPRMNVEGLGS